MPEHTRRAAIRRIARWALLWLALLVMALALSSRTWPLRPPPPWISLPATVSDAASLPQRKAMLIALGVASRTGDVALAATCGDDGLLEPHHDHYVLTIGHEPWGPYRRMRIEAAGGQATVRMSARFDGGGAVLAWWRLLPHRASADETDAPLAMRQRGTRIGDLRGLRAAWLAPALWGEVHGQVSDCRRGVPVLLEACVDGRYAVRFRQCGAAEERAAARLWRATEALAASLDMDAVPGR